MHARGRGIVVPAETPTTANPPPTLTSADASVDVAPKERVVLAASAIDARRRNRHPAGDSVVWDAAALAAREPNPVWSRW